jgi:hypothetical protein
MKVIARPTSLLGQETHGITRLVELLDVSFGGDARLSGYKKNLSPFNV